jgi:mono/diheme cytochrome c family protein
VGDPVGKHNGHDDDGTLAYEGKLHVKYPYKIFPGSYGGVESNMAYAGGLVYAENVNSYELRPNAEVPLGSGEAPSSSTGDVTAISVKTGTVVWKDALPSMGFSAVTVSNNLVFTSDYDGTVMAFNRMTGKRVWKYQLPAYTNGPLVIQGNTMVVDQSFPASGELPQVVAFRLGAKGGSTAQKPAKDLPASGAVSVSLGASVFSAQCASCHTLAASKSTGWIGPNLDKLKPSEAAVEYQVSHGGGGMPNFGPELPKNQIVSVAKYVSSVAGKKAAS